MRKWEQFTKTTDTDRVIGKTDRKKDIMNIELIYEDKNTTVKRVDYMGKFLYTVTYILNEEGLCIRKITVFADGTVDIQNFNKGVWNG